MNISDIDFENDYTSVSLLDYRAEPTKGEGGLLYVGHPVWRIYYRNDKFPLFEIGLEVVVILNSPAREQDTWEMNKMRDIAYHTHLMVLFFQHKRNEIFSLNRSKVVKELDYFTNKDVIKIYIDYEDWLTFIKKNLFGKHIHPSDIEPFPYM